MLWQCSTLWIASSHLDVCPTSVHLYHCYSGLRGCFCELAYALVKSKKSYEHCALSVSEWRQTGDEVASGLSQVMSLSVFRMTFSSSWVHWARIAGSHHAILNFGCETAARRKDLSVKRLPNRLSKPSNRLSCSGWHVWKWFDQVSSSAQWALRWYYQLRPG